MLQDILGKDTLKIGVVGYCPPSKFDEVKARRMIIEAYDRIGAALPNENLVVVSGLCNVGVLKIAYEEAVRRGWPTVGIACKRALEHPLFPVDKKIILGEEWGEESSHFVGMIDAIIRIGGGKQSLRETAEVKAKGGDVFEYDLPAQ